MILTASTRSANSSELGIEQATTRSSPLALSKIISSDLSTIDLSMPFIAAHLSFWLVRESLPTKMKIGHVATYAAPKLDTLLPGQKLK